MSEIAAVVGWYGPYLSITEARDDALKYYSDGLYAVFGYEKLPVRGRPKFLYTGVGAPLSTRLVSSHHRVGEGRVAKITSIWLGEISSHKRPGRREKKIEPLRDAVEWAMIALLKPALNQRRTLFPDKSLAIMNRWWSSADFETPVSKPLARWPDVIECAGAHAPAYLCWLEQKKVVRIDRPVIEIST